MVIVDSPFIRCDYTALLSTDILYLTPDYIGTHTN